jgi:hypothetical protein
MGSGMFIFYAEKSEPGPANFPIFLRGIPRVVVDMRSLRIKNATEKFSPDRSATVSEGPGR